MLLFARMFLLAAALERAASLVLPLQNKFISRRRIPLLIRWNYFSYKSQITMSTTNNQQQEQEQEHIDGKLVARIIPKEYIDFERFKPIDRRLQEEKEVDIWRKRIKRPVAETFQQQPGENEIDNDVDNQVVVLDIQLETTYFDPETESTHPVTTTLALQRDSAETAQRTLRRIEISTQRRLEGRKPKSQRRTSSSTSLIGELSSSILVHDSSLETCEAPLEEDEVLDGYMKLQIEEGMESKELWLSLMHGSKSRLWMDEITESGILLDLDPCPPTLLYVRNFEDFSADVFVGVPLVIETKALHADRAVVVWFAGDTQVCFDSHFYTPTLDDVGKKITALISPIRQDRQSGCEEVYEFQNTVTTRPNLPILDRRDSWLVRDDQGGSTIRVFSYNLMADIHLSPEVERRAKYADCDVAVLARTRRIPLLLYEILQHNADIICLQEVDATIYEQLLSPALHAHGFLGFYSNKATSQLEGTSKRFRYSSNREKRVTEKRVTDSCLGHDRLRYVLVSSYFRVRSGYGGISYKGAVQGTSMFRSRLGFNGRYQELT
jgi:hypothetical protein